ncbi:ATP-binding protein [Gordonibacter pamelaeae]|uniref:ATP-binding protein n=1 Tax=Gordonibacter pamelaeae TaxID=471189 RepID=UPI0002DB9DA1|nr:ATP-binding protein [Gordonibacter pamelaeae]
MQNIGALIENLRQLSNETEYVEFKKDFAEPEKEAKDICALANAAAFHDASAAYKVWGIEDKTHEVVGTSFNPKACKKGNQELEIWLRQHLSANAHFEFIEHVHQGASVVVLKIWPAYHQPVQYDNVVYIRTGSCTQKLAHGSTRESELWKKIQKEVFEDQLAIEDLSGQEVFELLDINAYFRLSGTTAPESLEAQLHYFLEEGMLERQDNGMLAITNLGAVLFSKSLEAFPTVKRKAVRVMLYSGRGRIDMLKERTFDQGYAVCMEALFDYVMTLVPARETIQGALRTTVTAYPAIAVRELVANALIHQDFTVTGAAPLIELFDHRIEFTNPGSPLVEVDRIVNDPPRSRNEKLASLMRRLHMCEEAGSGWDKIISACEHFRMPAPKIEIREERSMRVSLRQAVPYKNLSPQERLEACYWHACICYAQGDYATNQSLRERFDLKPSNASQISRLIKEAAEGGLIKPVDPNTSPRYMKYEPAWA